MGQQAKTTNSISLYTLISILIIIIKFYQQSTILIDQFLHNIYYINQMKRVIDFFRKKPIIDKKPRQCQVIRQNHESSVIKCKTLDFCKSCNIEMCNVCGDSHIGDHCSVLMKTNKSLGEGVLKEFNMGLVARVDLRDIKCICGVKIGKSGAICPACGLASCSEKCHQKWEESGNCTYRNNFLEVPKNFTFRSITFQNIQNIRNAKIKRWQFNPDEGAWQIGQDLISLLVMPLGNLILSTCKGGIGTMVFPIMNSFKDVVTHIERLCDCVCFECVHRGDHSVGNCETTCHRLNLGFKQTPSLRPKYFYQCKCECSICRSGIIMETHQLIDCYHYCHHSQGNLNNE